MFSRSSSVLRISNQWCSIFLAYGRVVICDIDEFYFKIRIDHTGYHVWRPANRSGNDLIRPAIWPVYDLTQIISPTWLVTTHTKLDLADCGPSRIGFDYNPIWLQLNPTSHNLT